MRFQRSQRVLIYIYIYIYIFVFCIALFNGARSSAAPLGRPSCTAGCDVIFFSISSVSSFNWPCMFFGDSLRETIHARPVFAISVKTRGKGKLADQHSVSVYKDTECGQPWTIRFNAYMDCSDQWNVNSLIHLVDSTLNGTCPQNGPCDPIYELYTIIRMVQRFPLHINLYYSVPISVVPLQVTRWRRKTL